MSQFRENLRTDGRKDGQILFHGNLLATTGGPMKPHVLRMFLVDIANIAVNFAVKTSSNAPSLFFIIYFFSVRNTAKKHAILRRTWYFPLI